MSGRERLALGALLLLALAGAGLAARVVRRQPGLAADLGAAALHHTTPEMAARLASLSDPVFLTLYLSDAAHMPSELRGLERDLVALCETLEHESGGKIAYQIVDPTGHPDLERYAAHRGVAPLKVRSIERDGYSERTVWCSLTVESGSHPPARIEGLRPEQLGRLQALLVATLDQMEHPRRPRIALAAGAGYDGLAAALASRGELQRVDLEAGAPIPAEADLLVWMDPVAVDAARVRELDLFVQSGRSVLLAGSDKALAGWDESAGGGLAVRLERRASALDAVLPAFGLKPIEGLLCDEICESVALGAEERPAPLLPRCLAQDQDFQALRGQPNGTLLFRAPTGFALDGERLQQRGATAAVLATTSERAWVQPFAPGALRLDAVVPSAGEPAGKQPLLVAVRPSLPWQGLLVAAASSSPFTDGLFERDDVAHRALLAVLLDELVSDGRLVQARVGREAQAPLPELSPDRRALWRAVCVLLFPAALVATALLRGVFGRRGGAGRRAAPRWAGAVALRGALALVVALGAAVALGASGARLDLTEERLNELTAETRGLAAAATGPQALTAELVFSSRERLSPALRSGLSRLRDLLGELRRQGAEIEVHAVDPDALGADELAALASQGLAPVQISDREGEVTSVRSVYAGLRLSAPARGRSTALAFPDAAAFETLEFRLAFALWRLQSGRTVRVGFASDAPRLTAAESQVYYQKQGLLAPSGSDVYSLARQRLSASDFEVTWINPADPQLPAGLDALVWMQPRRPAQRMLGALAAFVDGGGAAFVAAQQFDVVPRQKAEAGFELAYWPQPQITDLETGWLADRGVLLVRKPFFDAHMTSAPLATQVFRGGRREFSVMDAALPFIVRASAARYASDSLVTRNLGDLVLVSPSRIELDEERLKAAGLTARALISSSETSWELDWAGGVLPESTLAGPPVGEGDKPLTLGAVPLAVDVTGRGRLVLVGCSELFRDQRLLDPDVRGDQLLLNAVAALALDPALAAVASQRPVARGFEQPDPETRLRWRAGVVFAPPAAVLALAALVALRKRGGR